MPCTKRNCCKKASLRRRSYSLHEGRLKVRDNSAHVVFTAWWEKHTSYASTAHLHRNGDKHRSRVSIRQDLPTACRHPLAPQDLPSHPTQREEEVKGRRGREKEKKKTGHRCEACRTQPHRRDERTIERDTLRHGYGDGDG